MPRSLSRDRLVSLLQSAGSRRVAVVGDAMLDVYLRGDVERISPEAPVPVVRVRDRRYALGGAGHVAQNVRAVGAGCGLVATAGADAGGVTKRTTRITTKPKSSVCSTRCGPRCPVQAHSCSRTITKACSSRASSK